MKEYLNQLNTVITHMTDDEAAHLGFERAKEIFTEAISLRKKILVIGNGGSAGEAQRFALAFVVKFQKEHEAYPAICLAADPSLLTAIANDYGFAEEFARQVEALGNEGDILVSLSVSGNSENVIRAINKAKGMGLKTFALIGKDGGKMKGMCDAEIVVPSNDGSRVQEIHLFILDALCAELETCFK